ncbi:MAG: LysM peptidoglycan-binding domain-containing protein [Actinobacteria bacterium]|jgi:nucleoid-associated protein YgaU/DNA-binding SARP family transcriptional activator|nr:LysM peptidoglycan-binding domain-containing protein [Actinomycetota bacterium]
MRKRSVELVRGLTALLLLAGLLLGLPAALVTVVGSPLPTELPSWSSLERALTTGELENWTLVKGLALLVWIAWAQLATSTIAETIAIARGHRMGRVPSARPLRVTAANLVTTAALLFGSAGRVADAAVLPPSDLHVALATGPSSALVAGDGPTHAGRPVESHSTLVAAPAADEASDGEVSRWRADSPTWTVAPRDTLWGIAETVLGNGLRWREIHDLNVGRRQPDSGALRAGDDLIRPGWILHLPPDAVQPQHPTETGDEASRPVTAIAKPPTIAVQAGDTLWDLAGQHLDDPHRWPELHDANHGRPQPDGSSLTDPDLIHPGWQLTVPTATDDDTDAPPDLPDEPASTAEPSEGPIASATEPLPWPSLERSTSQQRDTDEARTPNDVRGDSGAVEATQSDGRAAVGPGGPPQVDDASDPDAENRSIVFTGAGVAAAGVALTLDRLRRARQRRRAPGQSMCLPEGGLAATEQRVRGLADRETADLLDIALRSLAASCARKGRPVPEIALVSVGIDDVAIHLAESDTDPVGTWRVEDAGMTWALPRPPILEPLRKLANQAGAPTPLLVTIGTHAHGQRRVLLNLGHAKFVAVTADEQTTRAVLLSYALELATTARADGLQVLLCGAGDRLATLERIRCTAGTEALRLLQRAATDEADAHDTDATVAVLLEPPPAGLLEKLTSIASQPSGSVAAIGSALPDARWRLTIGETVVVAPYGLRLHPLELGADDVEALEQLLVDAADPAFVEADLADLDENEPRFTAAPSSNGHASASGLAADDSPAQGRIEVRVLGPVEVAGAGDFGSAKAEELIVYLALHRDGVDVDSLQEALWPSEPPNVGRLHTVVWRARQALGDDADGEPYLPKAKQGRYRISDSLAFDFERFQALTDRAQSDPDRAADHLQAALDRVRGIPLTARSSGYSWTAYILYHIEQQITDAAHELAQLYLKRDDPERARWAAEQGLRADPYCEVLHRDLMSAASMAGNTSDIPAIMRRLRQLIEADGDANDNDDHLDPQTIDLYHQLTITSRP